MNMEENSHNVPIEQVLQQSKSLVHSMEESLRCKSQTIPNYYSLRKILSHDSNSITTSFESNSIHESHSTETLKMKDKFSYMPIEEVIQPSKSFENSMEENPHYESHNIVFTLMSRKRDPARLFFLENLAANLLLFRPTCLSRHNNFF